MVRNHNIRFNDGKCDPKGRFWAGTMSYDEKKNQGTLYCLESDLVLKKVINKVSISNGIVWTKNKKTMYYIDSPTHEVVAYKYDLEAGKISDKKTVIKVNKKMGVPDGMSIDENGNLWIALYGGGGVGCWNPSNGKQISFVSVPYAKPVTSCAFGGSDRKDLYITTASVGLDEGSLGMQQNAGYLFHIKLPVRGAVSYRFRR